MVRLSLFSLLVLGSFSRFLEDNEAPVLTDAEIDAINSAGLWQADKSLIANLTIGKVRSKYRPGMAPRLPIVEAAAMFNETMEFQGIPATFDSRTSWPGCISEVMNEGDCVGNWAIAAAQVLSDRICVQKKSKAAISPQYILNCQTRGSGCDGGTADAAWNFLLTTGAPSTDCISFQGQTEKCLSGKCAKTLAFSSYRAANVKVVSGIPAMQNAIILGGPIEACFEMYTDLLAYRSGIYIKTSGSIVGTQCVKVIGWGVQGASKYWIAEGTSGSAWGQSGFFYYKMGQGGIETNAIAGDPA